MLLVAIGGAIITAPTALPAVVVNIAGYLAVAGGIASAISQATTTEDDSLKKKNSVYKNNKAAKKQPYCFYFYKYHFLLATHQ